MQVNTICCTLPILDKTPSRKTVGSLDCYGSSYSRIGPTGT